MSFSSPPSSGKVPRVRSNSATDGSNGRGQVNSSLVNGTVRNVAESGNEEADGSFADTADVIVESSTNKHHVKVQQAKMANTEPSVPANLWSNKLIVILLLWYFFSFTTLFLNKYILTFEGSDPTMLGME